jgi:tricorn protease
MQSVNRRGPIPAPLAGLFVLIAILTAQSGPASAKPGYLRNPSTSGDRVAFCAEGDLWVAPLAGGDAQRITTHPGNEALPKFSPDGKWIAFAGDYDGNRDVFVVPADGGEPTRMTWHPAPDEPLGWSADGKEIVFRSVRDQPNWNWAVYRIPASGGDPTAVPIGYAVAFSVDPETGRYAFTRSGGGGTWKRYRGGTADDIWVGDPKKSDYAQVTDFDGMDAFPMWHAGRIYFVCDMGGTANIWSMAPDGKDRKRLTDFGNWDVRWPTMDESGRIAFTVAGDIHVLDSSTGTERKISIDLPSERKLTRVRYPDAAQYLTGFALSPDGDRVAVGVRGELFSIPAEKGLTLPITRGSGARESRVTYGPKGKRVLYITDESGEQGLVTADAWGRGDVKLVDKPGQSHFHYDPVWSPDGAWIAWSDETQTLWVAKADGGDASGGPRKVDHSDQGEIREYAWSPDGRWLAYAKMNSLEFNAIFIYDTKDGSTHQVTSFNCDNRSPAWDPDGRYLYFLSDRNFDPVIDRVDFETIVVMPTRPYMVLLRKDVENPFAKIEGAPPKDEDKKDKDKKDKDVDKGKDKGEEKDKDKGGDDAEKAPEPVVIDFDGIADRYVEVPVEPGRYFGLAALSDKIFYLDTPTEGLLGSDGGDDGPRGALMTYDIKKQKAKTFMDGVANFDLQAKKKKIAVMKKPGEIYVVDAESPPGDDLGESQISFDDVVIELNPQEEWHQIFFEGWRNMRDFYWDAGMHGLDWPAIRDQYASLLPRISTRDDLQDLIAEMIGELATSHTYVWGGDRGISSPSVSTGLLGATLVREGDVFRVERILRADPLDRLRSSLSEPEASVKEGEYLIAVNSRPFSATRPFEASMQNMAGKKVLLTVNSKPSRDGARDVVVKALSGQAEGALRYADWVRRNREYVAEKSGGKIAYIHIPDMGGRGLNEFNKWFYPQLDKEGMVVDARWNGGGFVSQLIVSRLARHVMWWDRARWGGTNPYPFRVLNGPFVVLTNQFAGSDGDIFPAAVQTAKLAPVIGKRSWGGVIGIRGNARPLVDSGILTQPEFAWWSPTKGWGIENHGVDPDIPIDNLPQDVARGADPQLDRAITEVMRLRETKPAVLPNFPPAPDRSRKSYATEK